MARTFIDDINDTDYSNFGEDFSFKSGKRPIIKNLGERTLTTSSTPNLNSILSNLNPFRNRKKITPNQKFSRLKWLFNNSKFLQNYVQLLARKKQLQEQLKVMRNQQEVQKVQSEISSLEQQIKMLQAMNKISLQKRVEGAVPTEIIQAVMVSSIPASGVINDNYIDEISNSVSDSSVVEIPTNIPSDNGSGGGGGIGYEQPSEPLPSQQEPQQGSEVVDNTTVDLPKKDNTILYLGIGIIAVLLLTRK